jgi:hypothetical protein
MNAMNFKRSVVKDDPRSGVAVSNRAAAERSPSGPAAVTHDVIAKLAFQKWQKRGCPTGEDQRDWFEAERELKGPQASGARRG